MIHRVVIAALLAAAAACIDASPVGDLPAPPSADAAPTPDAVNLGACTLPLDCPAPTSPELATVCGQLFDTHARAPLSATTSAPTGTICDPMNPAESGPCSVCLNAYAPAALVIDPGDADALPSDAIELDDCGRFRMIDIAPPDDGAVALLAGNCNPVANRWAPTAVALRTTPDMRVPDQRLFATDRAVDRQWTDTAGRPFGDDTYVSRGAVLATFVHDGQPQPGVTLTIGGLPLPGATHYFADSAGALSAIDMTRSNTGATGSALAIGTGFVLHGGVGAEPFGCVWPADMAASIPGVLFVQHKPAVSAPTGDQCHAPGISGNLR